MVSEELLKETIDLGCRGWKDYAAYMILLGRDYTPSEAWEAVKQVYKNKKGGKRG